MISIQKNKVKMSLLNSDTLPPHIIDQVKFGNNLFANIPAMGGKKKVHASLMMVNFHPRMPTSMGNRPTAHSDQPVKNATIVPTLAPALKRPAAMGRLTKGPPGASPPATVPIKTPRKPDSNPTYLGRISLGMSTWTMPATMNANIRRGRT